MATALNVSAWSTTAASNSGADSTIGTVADTSSPTSVDDWVRSIMAAMKKYVLDTDGGLTSGGSANAQTLTTNRSISSGHQAAGFSCRFKAGYTNTGATTLAVDGLTAVAIKRVNGDALSAGDIVTGGIYDVAFDGTYYVLLGAGGGSGTYGALTGDNTWSGANTFTGSVTVGDGSGDVVVIKGTTVHATMSALLSNSTTAAFNTAIGLGTGSSVSHGTITSAGQFQVTDGRTILRRDGSSTAGNEVATVQRLDYVANAEFLTFLNVAGATFGSITGSGFTDYNTAAYNTSSDGRLKNAQRAISDSGDVIDRLRPIRFDWVHGGEDFGFVAQEVDAVVPGFVKRGDDDPDRRPGDEGFVQWQMQYGRLEPFVVAELQSVRRRLAALEAG